MSMIKTQVLLCCPALAMKDAVRVKLGLANIYISFGYLQGHVSDGENIYKDTDQPDVYVIPR